MQKTATKPAKPAKPASRRKNKAPAKGKRARPGKSTVPHPLLPAGNAGILGGNQSGNASRGIRYSVLTSELGSKSLFQIAIDCNDREGQGWVNLLDTERKQLRCIADLWAIVKAQPKYETLNKTNWKATDKHLDVIAWLMRKLGVLANGDKWLIDLQQGKYVFVVYRNFHSQMVRNDIEWVALDFLPVLATKDKPLHDLIIDLVALMHTCNAIPLWDDDYYTGRALNYLLNENVSENSVRKDYKTLYSTGLPAQYLQLIREQAKVVTIDSIRKKKRDYYSVTSEAGKELSARKRVCLYWIESGIIIAEWGRKISEFSFSASWTGKHVAAEHLYKWMWDTSSDDPLRMKFDILFDQDEDAGGMSLPVTYTICRPGEVLQPLVEDSPSKEVKHHFGAYRRHCFAEELCGFLRDGNSHFKCAEYESYYYNTRKSRSINSPLTTGGIPLLDLIERNELANEIRNS